MSSHNEILLELYKMLGQITKILEENKKNEKVIKDPVTSNQKSAGIQSGYYIDNTMKEWVESLRN